MRVIGVEEPDVQCPPTGLGSRLQHKLNRGEHSCMCLSGMWLEAVKNVNIYWR